VIWDAIVPFFSTNQRDYSRDALWLPAHRPDHAVFDRGTDGQSLLTRIQEAIRPAITDWN
jgi:hypothetical protein